MRPSILINFFLMRILLNERHSKFATVYSLTHQCDHIRCLLGFTSSAGDGSFVFCFFSFFFSLYSSVCASCAFVFVAIALCLINILIQI